MKEKKRNPTDKKLRSMPQCFYDFFDVFLSTGIDSLIRLIKEKKQIELLQAGRLLNIPVSTIEEWAILLEKNEIILIKTQKKNQHLIWNPKADESLNKIQNVGTRLTEVMELIDKTKLNNKIAITNKDNDFLSSSSPFPVSTTFSHVGGMQKLKRLFRFNLIEILKNKELSKKYGKTVGGGYILYGPPGCGKSFVIGALAGEANLPLIKANIADILNMYVGNSEKNLARIFQEAKEKQPCILFFDEIEALGGNREGMSQHFERTLVNQFLMEMDNIEKQKLQVVVIGATNVPWHVDHALRRSGRFTHMVFVEPPDHKARIELFRLYTKKKTLLGELDYDELASLTDGFSCANIKFICEKACDRAWQDAVASKKERSITMDDFRAVIQIEKSDVKEWFMQAKQFMHNPLFRENYQELLSSVKKSGTQETAMFG